MTEPQRAAEEQPKPPETKAAERDARLELKPPPALHEEMRAEGLDSASVLEDDQFTQERYEEIKARTMFNMIEEIDAGKQSLLFLTNKQAELLASPENVAKLVSTLEVNGHVNGKPKLLIVLQWDGKFRAQLAAAAPASTGPNAHERTNGAFLNGDDARAAESRLDRFMLEVLIPLAVQTNAMVICDAVKEFELSASFLRMVAVQRASFGATLPFSVLAFTDEIHCFYANTDPNCHWRAVRRQSRAWAKRDQKLVEHNCRPEHMKNRHRYDLSADAPLVIITDGIDAKQDKPCVRGPAARLLTALIRHLNVVMGLPSIAFRTGYGRCSTLKDESAPSMLRALDALNSNCPVIFLDVRQREVCTFAVRQEMIDKAKADYNKLCDKLVEAGTFDWLNVCAVAWFHDVLFGDGDPSTTGNQAGSTMDAGSPTAIHEALRLRRLRERQGSTEALQSASEQPFRAATPEQVLDVARFLSERFHKDYLERKQSQLRGEGKSEDEIMKAKEDFGNQQQAAAQIFTMLLSHESFHGANAADVSGVRRLVQALVKLDRLPKENSIEALKLLQMAWMHHDVAIHLADKYVRLASVLYAMILLVGVATVACTTVLANDTQQHAVFALAMAQTVLLLAVKFYNPTVRGNQLRASAATLESIIWLFRTRVSVFAVPQNQPSQPTAALRAAMTSWHAGAVTGTDLLQTSLEREHPARVYTHCQIDGTLRNQHEFMQAAAVERELNDVNRKLIALQARRSSTISEDGLITGDIERAETGAVGGSGVASANATDEATLKQLRTRRAELEGSQNADAALLDDHQSPVRPALYVEMRLLVMRKRYQLKIPRCYAWRRVWELILTCCTVASATLSYLDDTSHYVAVSSSVAAAVTSWLSHVELTRRIERYSNTVRSINDLIWWWESLDDAERANTANITKLIETGESVLATERLAWIAAARKNDEAAADDDKGQARDAPGDPSTQGRRSKVAPE